MSDLAPPTLVLDFDGVLTRGVLRLVGRHKMTVQRLVQRFADTGVVGLLLRHRIGGDLVRPSALAVYTL